MTGAIRTAVAAGAWTFFSGHGVAAFNSLAVIVRSDIATANTITLCGMQIVAFSGL